VPWCPDCDRFYNPNSLSATGECPTCGRALGDDTAPAPEKLRKFSDEPAPWHFKVLVGCVSVYLGWRLLQGVFWVGHHL
jgi:hypothetical protein